MSKAFRFSAFLGICLLLLPACQTASQFTGANPSAGQPETRTIEQSYRLILRNYLKFVDPDDLLTRAVAGMKEVVGEEKSSFTRSGNSHLVSTQGQTVRVERAYDEKQGTQELRRVYSFVLTNNPGSDQKLIAAAIQAMASLDNFSYYSSIEMNSKSEMKPDQVPPAAIGLEIASEKDGRIRILDTIDSSPAEKSGILPKDFLLAIDGQPVKDLPLVDIVRRLRGENGSEVVLTIQRNGTPEPLVFSLARRPIVRRTVSSQLIQKNYGYVRISRFEEGTASALDALIDELKQESNGELRGLIIDLRDKAGGLLSESIEVARRFIQSGLILALEGRLANQTMKFFAQKRTFYPFPLVVLVNGTTAAGSEILAGTLQDHKRAIVVGTPTARKDSIQTLLPLDDGSFLKITTAVWRLPRGVSIESTGIVPDVINEAPFDRTVKDLGKDAVVGICLKILSKKGTAGLLNVSLGNHRPAVAGSSEDW